MRRGRLLIRYDASGRQRLISLVATGVLHILLIAWLTVLRPVPVVQQATLSQFSLKTLSMPQNRPESRPLSAPPMPSPRKPPHSDPPSMTASDREGMASNEDTGKSCAPVEAIAKSIMQDADALAALRAVPKSERSISEVIVIWNAGWSASSEESAVLMPLRQNILHALHDLNRDCLAQPVAGPRLIQISTEAGTIFLAIGSGNWSWNQLYDYAPQSLPIDLPLL